MVEELGMVTAAAAPKNAVARSDTSGSAPTSTVGDSERTGRLPNPVQASNWKPTPLHEALSDAAGKPGNATWAGGHLSGKGHSARFVSTRGRKFSMTACAPASSARRR